MATYILINTVRLAKGTYKSGSTINSLIHPVSTIQAGGGLLVPTATYPALATAAAEVLALWNSGKDQATCDSAMSCAYQAVVDSAEQATNVVDSSTVTLHGKVTYAKPLAAELVSIVADVLIAAGAQIIASQPNVPCKLQVRITDANSSISAGTVTIVGVGAAGQALSQVIPLAGGTRTVVTTDAYASVTSATIAGLAGHGAGDNIGIGVGSALGLPIPAGATDVSVYKATVDYVNEAVGTVDATARTVAPTTAGNGTRVFEFWYTYKVAHTHTLS